MFKLRSAVVLFTGLTLAVGSSALLAQPDKGKDRHSPQQYRYEDGERMEYYRGDRYRENFRVDHDHVRVVIGDHRDYWGPGPGLPPGIRKNLRRGKPLPPGIDKHWLDGRLERQLPRYYGHEWVRVGNDLVLISVSTRLINDVLYDIFH